MILKPEAIAKFYLADRMAFLYLNKMKNRWKLNQGIFFILINSPDFLSYMYIYIYFYYIALRTMIYSGVNLFNFYLYSNCKDG